MERASRGIPKGSYKGEIAEIRFFTIDYSFEIYPRSGDNNSELRIPNLIAALYSLENQHAI